MLRVLVGARPWGVSLRLLLRLGPSRGVAFKVNDSGFCRRVKVCSERRKVPGSQKASVCDCGARLGGPIR